MSDFLKAVFLSFVMFILGLGVFWIGPLPKGVGHNQSPASAPTLAKPAATAAATQSPSPVVIQARGPYRVQGNAILGADGNRYLFHGIGRDSLEYSCWGDGHFDAQELSYLGAGTTTIVRGHLAAWATLGVVFGFAISSARQADGGYTYCAEAQCDSRPAVDRCRWTIVGSRRSMGYAGCG